MSKVVRVLVVAPLMAAGAAALFLLVAMRTKSPRLLRTVRRVNKACWNPNAMRSAGLPGSTTSVVHHVGRVSGTSYATPVDAVPVEDGFVVALPYGRHSDWLQNLLAAGGGRIQHDGAQHLVSDPQVLPITEFLPAFAPSDQRSFRLFNVAECLHVRTAGASERVGADADTGEV
jgi:deazaflavin-dependent oxidoreductase (nitroreductase family)